MCYIGKRVHPKYPLIYGFIDRKPYKTLHFFRYKDLKDLKKPLIFCLIADNILKNTKQLYGYRE